jgi:hypothetical protein
LSTTIIGKCESEECKREKENKFGERGGSYFYNWEKRRKRKRVLGKMMQP